jgi:hypothetical protein
MYGFFNRLVVSIRRNTVAADVEQIKAAVTRILCYFQGHEGWKIFAVNTVACSSRTTVMIPKHYSLHSDKGTHLIPCCQLIYTSKSSIVVSRHSHNFALFVRQNRAF